MDLLTMLYVRECRLAEGASSTDGAAASHPWIGSSELVYCRLFRDRITSSWERAGDGSCGCRRVAASSNDGNESLRDGGAVRGGLALAMWNEELDVTSICICPWGAQSILSSFIISGIVEQHWGLCWGGRASSVSAHAACTMFTSHDESYDDDDGRFDLGGIGAPGAGIRGGGVDSASIVAAGCCQDPCVGARATILKTVSTVPLEHPPDPTGANQICPYCLKRMRFFGIILGCRAFRSSWRICPVRVQDIMHCLWLLLLY